MDLEDSKLVTLLKTLNKQEFERLEKYVKSPFFNSSDQLVKLFNLLKADYPDFALISKEKIFRVFYPREEFKDKKIRDLLSRLLELAQGFLSQIEFEKRSHLENVFAMNQMIGRGLERHYKGKYRESEKKLKEEIIIDDEYLYTEYLFSKIHKLNSDIFSNIGYEGLTSEMMYKEYDHFLNFVIFKILYYTLTFSIRKYTLKNEVNLEFAQKVIEFLDENPGNKYPVIPILRKVLKLQERENEPVTTEDTEIYHSLIKELNKNSNTIKQEDRMIIYVYLVNYTRIKSLASNKYFKEEHYNILKYSIENELYPKIGKYFDESAYRIVASTAMTNKDFVWAEEFIEKFKHELKNDVRENAYRLCMANLKYRTGFYDEALKYLIKVSIEDISYQLKVKNLQIKIHYELGNYEMCKSVIDSFKHFLAGAKQFPEFLRIRFVNYANFTSRLVNVWLGGDPKNMIEINKNLADFPQEKVESKSWLLAQAQKIKY